MYSNLIHGKNASSIQVRIIIKQFIVLTELNFKSLALKLCNPRYWR